MPPIIHIKLLDDWNNITDDAAFTQGTNPIPMTETFLKKALTSRHSIIRSVRLRIDILGLPYCNHVHFVRHHVGHNWFIRTQRPDGVNPVDYDRRAARQDAPVNARDRLNLEALLSMMEKRLCMCAAKETRGIALAIKAELSHSDDPFLRIVGQFCQPSCEWRGGRCPEVFRPCGKYPLLEVIQNSPLTKR